jgi:predicted esterase
VSEERAAATLRFVHRYVAPTGVGARADLTVLALHGTGGDENDLVGLAQAVLPGAGVLSPRGLVLENGMSRFFRRVAEGVFDEADLIAQSASLAKFVTDAAALYHFDQGRVIAMGFSNGANVAASLLLLHPHVLRAAALLRAMVPLVPTALPPLDGTPVLLSSGLHDPIVPRANVEQLAAMLRSAGATVELHWESGGHAFTPHELPVVREWCERTSTAVAGLGQNRSRG